MSEIKLIGGLIATVDDEDFERINQFVWRLQKGYRTSYAVRREGLKVIQMANEILGVGSKTLIDHKNRNGLFNCKSNLREATVSQNGANRTPKKHGWSNYLGVCWSKSKMVWVANISKEGKNYSLGSFKKESEAALAYNQKASELHGEFANLNVIDPIKERQMPPPKKNKTSVYVNGKWKIGVGD